MRSLKNFLIVCMSIHLFVFAWFFQKPLNITIIGFEVLIVLLIANVITSAIIIIKNKTMKSERLKSAYIGSSFAVGASIIIFIAMIVMWHTVEEVGMAMLAIFWLPLLEYYLASIVLFMISILMMFASLPLFLTSTIIYFMAYRQIKKQL